MEQISLDLSCSQKPPQGLEYKAFYEYIFFGFAKTSSIFGGMLKITGGLLFFLVGGGGGVTCQVRPGFCVCVFFFFFGGGGRWAYAWA